ncbi:MAG: type II toxin-antitoxin system VapC family toxin [Gammaproteobacteria bacterium]
MKLVIDAPIALAWLFERNKMEEVNYANRVLSVMSKAETTVPNIWHLEVTNALLIAEKQNIMTDALVIDYLNRLSQLGIKTDEVITETRRDFLLSFARQHQLSLYEITYLELSLRTHSALATFNQKLAAATRAAGGTIFI